MRAAFFRSKGKVFSAGADLTWMKKTTTYTREQNLADSLLLGGMLSKLNRLPFPTIALVQGAAFGGGVGLISCCDVAIGANGRAACCTLPPHCSADGFDVCVCTCLCACVRACARAGVSAASFTLSEVRLGILPATISPYVIARIGAAQARRYFLTAERFNAERARQIGLLHEVVDTPEDLETWAATLRKHIIEASPTGVAASKDLIRAVAGHEITADLIADTARRLSDQRASPEGVEGLTAFFERRPPVRCSANRSRRL